MRFLIATSTQIPKKGQEYMCRRLTKEPNWEIDCYIKKVIFALKLWNSNDIYAIVDNEGNVYFIQVQKK